MEFYSQKHVAGLLKGRLGINMSVMTMERNMGRGRWGGGCGRSSVRMLSVCRLSRSKGVCIRDR